MPGAISTTSKASPGSSAAAAGAGTEYRTVAAWSSSTSIGKVMGWPCTSPQVIVSVMGADGRSVPTPLAEHHADPGAGVGPLGHAVLEGALAGAALDQQVAGVQRERGGRSAAVGAQQEGAGVAERQDGDDGVDAVAADPVAVPGDGVVAVAVEVGRDRRAAPRRSAGRGSGPCGRAPPGGRASRGSRAVARRRSGRTSVARTPSRGRCRAPRRRACRPPSPTRARRRPTHPARGTADEPPTAPGRSRAPPARAGRAAR